MTSTNNNNRKNQVDTTDIEFGSFNEEEDQFINKKQLVHIEDDTSINVDMSEDDRSKSSSLKKSFLINNMSALNEQFPTNNQLNNKKNDNYNENVLNDMTNSADFYNSQNGLGNIPESNEERYINNYVNNDEVIQSLKTKIDNNGFFFSRKNKEISESENKARNKNDNNDNISIKDINEEDIDEEEYNNDNIEDNSNINNENNKNNIRTSQMMVKKELTPNEIINKYITNQNINNYNEEFLNNNINSNGGKSPNLNSNDFNINAYQEENFNFNIISSQTKLSGSVNSEQTFGLIQSREFQNKYAQLEAKYNTLVNQNKKLEDNYQELKNSNKSVLDLLTYWQKFYLEILEIVKPKNENKNNDNSISDYMDDPYRIQVINEVKKMVLLARDKAYNIFYQNNIYNFEIKGKENKSENNNENTNIINKASYINLSLNKIESICYKGNKSINYNNNENDINSSLPIKHTEKINAGTNTDLNGENLNKTLIEEISKEKEFQTQSKKYDKKDLIISSKVTNISFIKKIINKKNDIKQKQTNEESTKLKFNNLKMYSNIKLNYKGIAKSQKKFKKNIMHKIAIVQTDMTYKNISSIETLNKACSSQLLNTQKEKEKMQKQYEEKINSLNNYINENIKPAKKEKEKTKNNKNKEKEEKEKEDAINNLNTSLIFLPEMIPPENTYKIFIHCVKHFKYEEDIYKKYLEEEDLYTLKTFVEKMEKYLIGASLPLSKNKRIKRENKSKEKKERNTININYNIDNIKEDISQNVNVNRNNIIHNVKQKFNTNLKLSNNSENKMRNGENKRNNIYNNNNTFNKYKAAIMALKDY